MTEIKDQLLPEIEKSAELEYFFGIYFNQINITTNEFTVSYGEYIIMTYSKKHKIQSIEVDHNLISVEKIIQDIKEALSEENGIQVNSKIIFSPVIIEKYLRYRDLFQILPAPANVPKIDRSYIDVSHPFTLEYSFPKSNNIWINGFRSEKRYHELILVLNSLLRHGIELSPNSQSQEWVTSFSENTMKCEYLGLGYHINEVDTREKDGIGFTKTDDYDIFSYQESTIYYSTYGYSSDDYNRFLPSNFLESLDNYFLLEQNQKEKFLNSSYWTQVASKIFTTSQSAAFSGLVTSIEVFLPNSTEKCIECNKPISIDRCSTCKQPSAGPTKYFRDFIESYAPNIHVKLRNELYNLRSSILHGGKLMSADKKYLGGYGHNTESMDGTNKWHTLNSVIKGIQNNWLNSIGSD